jgi:hypothetical protein
MFVVAVVDPATFAGNLTVRYLALALWSLMFCWMAALVPARHRSRLIEGPPPTSGASLPDQRSL